VNLLPYGFEPGPQQFDLAAQTPFISWIIAKNGKREIVVNIDPQWDRLQIAFEKFNSLFER
jgi:hypothetical protein